jgi:hypothetical protein
LNTTALDHTATSRADLELDLGVAAVDLEAGDLADRQAGDHDLRADRHARGVAEPRPQRDVVAPAGSAPRLFHTT